jgi:FAD/FMN-containing dehydrogenase
MATLRAGGTISHHHGVGQSKAEFLPRELGSSMETYRRLKRVFDPSNVLNPAKMGLP